MLQYQNGSKFSSWVFSLLRELGIDKTCKWNGMTYIAVGISIKIPDILPQTFKQVKSNRWACFLESDIPVECRNVWTSFKNSHLTLTFKKRESARKRDERKLMRKWKRKKRKKKEEILFGRVLTFNFRIKLQILYL